MIGNPSFIGNYCHLRGQRRVSELKMAFNMRAHDQESDESHSRGDTAEQKSQPSEASLVRHIQLLVKVVSVPASRAA
jgi:hypothetical protein